MVAEMRAVRVRAGRGRSKQSCNQQLQPRAHIDWLDKREHAAVVGYLGRLGQSASVPDRQTASAPCPVATHPRPHAHGSRRARSRACRRRGSGACTSCPPRPRVGSGRAAPPRPNGFLTVNPNAFLTVAPNGLFGFGVERARAAAGSRPGLWVGMELLDHSDGLVQAELDGVRYFELETGGEAGLLSVYVRGAGGGGLFALPVGAGVCVHGRFHPPLLHSQQSNSLSLVAGMGARRWRWAGHAVFVRPQQLLLEHDGWNPTGRGQPSSVY